MTLPPQASSSDANLMMPPISKLLLKSEDQPMRVVEKKLAAALSAVVKNE